MTEKYVIGIEGRLFTTTIKISRALQMQPGQVHNLIEKHEDKIKERFPRGIKDAINLDEDHPGQNIKCLDYYAFHYFCDVEKLFFKLEGVEKLFRDFQGSIAGRRIIEKIMMMSDSCVVYISDVARIFDVTHRDIIEECEKHPDINLGIEVEGDFGYYTFNRNDIAHLLDVIDNQRTQEAKAELKNLGFAL